VHRIGIPLYIRDAAQALGGARRYRLRNEYAGAHGNSPR
jgi:hypothetical protein